MRKRQKATTRKKIKAARRTSEEPLDKIVFFNPRTGEILFDGVVAHSEDLALLVTKADG